MTIALVRGVSHSFADSLKLSPPPVPIDVDRATEQHDAYVAALRLLVDHVIEMPADELCPDCCFIEDTAVVIGKRALIARPGAQSRRAETAAVRAELERLGLELTEMKAPATLDGGDVLVVGRHIFAGRSRRTDEDGIEALRRAFPEHVVHAVVVQEGLHLKSLVTALDDRILVAAPTPAARAAAEAIRSAVANHADPAGSADPSDPAQPADAASSSGSATLEVVHVPDPSAANCLWVRGTVLASSNHPASVAVLRGLGWPVVEVDTTEIEKADGGLTCGAILVETQERSVGG